MSNWKKILLRTGVAACLFGGALIATGTATGGMNHLLQADQTKYSKKTEEFSNISALEIELSNRNLVIEESDDEKVHLTYYQGKEASERIVTKDNQGTLSVQQPKHLVSFGWSNSIRSFLNLFNNEEQRSTVTLSLPKGTKLSTLKGDSSLGDVSLSGLNVQKLDLSLSAGGLTINNSTIDNGSLSNSLGDINLNQSKLADSTIKLSSGSINSQQLTLTGDIHIDNSLGDVQLNLVKDSLNTLSFDLETSLGSIKVPENFQSITGENDEVGAKLKRIVENNSGKVFVRDSAGSIELSATE